LFEFSEAFLNLISQAERYRQDAYEKSKQLKLAVWKARSAMEYEDNLVEEAKMDQLLDGLVRQNMLQWQQQREQQQEKEASIQNSASGRDWSFFSGAMEEYARYKAFRHFLCTGSLIRFSDFAIETSTSTIDCPLRDEEYLAGACIGLTQDLVRYATGRATVQDVESVHMARDLTDALNYELLQFDFRNGPLRKKYDGVKYALKHLERILYELSMVTATDGIVETDGIKSSTLCQDEIKQIRERMEQFDNMREQLIKNCRDGQKAAKQAIFALHRQDVGGAQKLLHQCEIIILKELQQTYTLPELRYVGSLSALLEEFAEAKLLYLWMQENRIATYHSDFAAFVGEESLLLLQPEEYIGALCDFTAEVGRWAVVQGTKRDLASVKWCLETNMSIRNCIQEICYAQDSSKVINRQKIDQLRTNVEKLERMVYELSWTQGRPASAAAAILTASAPEQLKNPYDDVVEEECAVQQ